MKNFIKKYSTQLIATGIAFLFLELAFIFSKDVYPFQNANILVSDLYYVYAPIFNYVRDAILNGRGILSSFSFSMGQSMVGVLAYYCMSPLNLLLLFSNASNITYFIKVIIILKIVLCALNMSIYLNNKTNKMNNIIFSVIFALITYNLKYGFNLMWIDVVYILPLVILGLENIIEGKSPKLYIITLTFMMFCNFYIAFGACIFIFIYFLYYSLIKKKLTFKLFLKFVLFSIIPVLLNAILFLPTIFNMLDGKTINTKTSYDKLILYNPLNVIYNFTPGYTSGYILNDLPYFYVTAFVLVLFANYIFDDKISNREKWLSVGIVIFFVVTTLIGPLDLLFHCFRVPNSLYYRYMFVLPFFMISVVSRHNIKISWFSLIPITIIAVWAVAVETSVKMAIFAFLLFLYFFILKLKLKQFVILILFGELFYSSFINIKTFTGYGWYEDLMACGEKLDGYYPKGNEFYRIEMTVPILVNDSFFLSYYGISSFSPTITKASKTFLKDYMIYPEQKTLNYIYQDRYILDPYFLGVKYELVGGEEKEVKENEYYLPLIIKTESFDYFKPSALVIENGNNLYKMINGEYLFKEIDFEVVDCVPDKKSVGDNCKLKFDRKDGYSYYLETHDPDPNTFKSGRYVEYNEILEVDEDFEFYYHNKQSRTFKLYEYDKNSIKVQEENKFEVFKDEYMRLNIKEGSYLMSIPYDDSWHIKINGKEVKKIKVLDSLIGFEAEDGVLEIEYIPRGLFAGILISGATFMILFVYYARKRLM